jgi:hypothetical protein
MSEKEIVWNNDQNKENWDNITKISNKVKVLKDNEIYRVADVKKFDKTHKVVKEILRSKKYKKTLLKHFFQGEYKDLYDVIVEKKDDYKIDYFDENYIVVHLRTGDDLNERGLTIPNMIKILKEIKKYDKKKKVIIITAMHYGHHRTSNKFYTGKLWCYNDKNYQENLKRIHYFISKLEHELVDFVSNEDIDLDIMHLVFCKNLVYSPSCGAFARAIGEWHTKYHQTEVAL